MKLLNGMENYCRTTEVVVKFSIVPSKASVKKQSDLICLQCCILIKDSVRVTNDYWISSYQ